MNSLMRHIFSVMYAVLLVQKIRVYSCLFVVSLIAHAEVKLPGDETVLATVNESEITAYDVE